MVQLRANEFKSLLEMNELLFIESQSFIKADIPAIGEITYYPKANRLQINKGNEWKDDGYYFVKNHLNKNNNKKNIRELIVKHFDKCDISYCFEGADYVDDVFSSVEEAIIKICEEFNQPS